MAFIVTLFSGIVLVVALINVALGESSAYIQCPYDTTRLPTSVLTDATRTHPTLASPSERWMSPTYTDPGAVAASFDVPLSQAPSDAEFVVIGPDTGARSSTSSPRRSPVSPARAARRPYRMT